MRCGSLLVDCAGRSVERERRVYCVGGAVPGAVESEAGVASAGGNVFPCLAGLFAHRDVGAALRYGSIPRTVDGLESILKRVAVASIVQPWSETQSTIRRQLFGLRGAFGCWVLTF